MLPPYHLAMALLARWTATTLLTGAGALGTLLGIGSVALTPQGRSAMSASAQTMAVSTGIKRQREPQEGDAWGGCNDARAAGTAPIYRGEPGYRSNMDGDDDGIACEPQR